MAKMSYLYRTFSPHVKPVKICLGYGKTSIFIKESKFVVFGLIGLILVCINQQFYLKQKFLFWFFGLNSQIQNHPRCDRSSRNHKNISNMSQQTYVSVTIYYQCRHHLHWHQYLRHEKKFFTKKSKKVLKTAKILIFGYISNGLCSPCSSHLILPRV